MELQENYYELNNIRLHVMEAGNPDGNILLFLHGFPEFWYGWKKQIDYFADHGYFVVAPDQRGYNLSSKPSGIKSYIIDELAADIAALIQQLGDKKVFLVGHDWGGAVAWAMAIQYPKLLSKLIVLNLPHPQVMKKGFVQWPKQILKSWYVGFFQFPLLPEKFCTAFNFLFMEKSMRHTSANHTFSAEDITHYKKAWKQKGAVTAMINWYRATRYKSSTADVEIETPTLLLWGKKDLFLSYEMAKPSIKKCKSGKLVMLEDATHWLHHEKPDQVNKLIHEFIS